MSEREGGVAISHKHGVMYDPRWWVLCSDCRGDGKEPSAVTTVVRPCLTCGGQRVLPRV